MKILLILGLSLFNVSSFGAVDELLELQRTNDYQIKRFYMGRVGHDLSYIIDRTNRLCFALILPKKRKSQSALEISCDSFKTGPIHEYLANGVIVSKKRTLLDKIRGKKKKNSLTILNQGFDLCI
jgi:hypothetical protein